MEAFINRIFNFFFNYPFASLKFPDEWLGLPVGASLGLHIFKAGLTGE